MQHQIVSVVSDKATFLDSNGGLLYSLNLAQKADQFMLINLKNSKNQYVLAINKDELSKSGKVHAYP